MHLAPEVAAGLRSGLLDRARKIRTYYAGLRQRQNAWDRRLFQLAQLLTGPSEVRSQIVGRLCGRPKWPDIAASEIRLWLESMGFNPLIRL